MLVNLKPWLREMNSLIFSGVFTLDPNNGKLTRAIVTFLLEWFSRSVLAINPGYQNSLSLTHPQKP